MLPTIISAREDRRLELRANPLGLFISTIKAKPRADERAHKAAFKRLVKSDGYEDDLDRLIDEWLSIKYSTALTAAVPPTASEIRKKVAAKQAQKETSARDRLGRAAALAAKVRNVVMLDLDMPNGKKLRDCTGGELVKLGGRYQKLGEATGLRRHVGKVHSEEAVRKYLL